MDDRCVVCGRYVPEGRQVCYECEWSAVNRNRKMTREEIKEVLIRHRNAFANDHGWATSVLEALDTAIGVFAEPKEMMAREFIEIWNRLCKSYNTSPCEECPVHEWCMGPPRIVEYKEMEAVLVEWANEHPEKTRKTYKEDFLEKFPNAKKDGRGLPLMCRSSVYGGSCHFETAERADCAACWNAEMEDVDE